MKHTIEKMKSADPDGETGYAFIDESGSCIIIVYGERRRDSMTKYLFGDTDPIHLKYKIFYLE
jgi:hypothetical protein